MTATAQLKTTTRLDTITLTLTPREALLLAVFAGNTSVDDCLSRLKSGSYAKNPPFNCHESIAGAPTSDEARNLLSLYENLRDELKKSV